MTNLLDNELFSVLELGTKGCVTERGEVWDKMFLLLFGDVVFLGFG